MNFPEKIASITKLSEKIGAARRDLKISEDTLSQMLRNLHDEGMSWEDIDRALGYPAPFYKD